MDNISSLLERWKGTLASIAALLLIILQIINMLLTSFGHDTLDSLLAKKTASIETKADILANLVGQNGTRVEEIKRELDKIEGQLHK